QARLDRADDRGLFAVVADRLGGSRISDREWSHGVLDAWSTEPLAASDGSDAAGHGADADGRELVGLRLVRPQFSGVERQSRLRRVSYRDVAPAGGRAARFLRIPEPAAARQ